VEPSKIFRLCGNPDKKHALPTEHHPWYLSRGPVLDYNDVFHPGGFGADEENENTFRQGFKLSGLEPGDRILLMDGPTVFREWRATEATFTTEHTWSKGQMRYFVVEVVRNNQVVLLTSRRPWAVEVNSTNVRSPKFASYNYQPDDHGNYYVSGIPLGPHYKSWPPATLIYATVKSWLLGSIGIEYIPPMTRAGIIVP